MVSSVDRGEAAEDWTGGRWTTESLVSRSEQIQHPNDDDRSSSNNQNDTVILPSIQQHTHHQQQSAAGAPFRIQHTNETGNPHFTSNVDSRGRMIQTAAQHHHRHHLRRRRRSCTCSLSDHCPSSKFWRCSCPRYTSNKQHSSIRMRIRMGLLLQMLLLLFHRRGEAAAASNNAFQLEPNTTNNNNPATQIWFIPPLDDNDESSSNNSNARNVPVGIPIQIPVGPPTQKPSTLKPTFLRFTPTPSNTLTMTTLEPTTLTTRNDQSSSPRSLRPSVGVMSQSPSARPVRTTDCKGFIHACIVICKFAGVDWFVSLIFVHSLILDCENQFTDNTRNSRKHQ